MKNAENSPIPGEVVSVIETLEKAGFQAFLVGGSVRDILLGRNPKDWDVTTNAKPEQIQALYPKTVYENAFGTVAVINEKTEDDTLRSIEVTPFRLESGYSDKRHPDKVTFSETIEDDLMRRDFTINAMAISLSNGAIKDIIDLYGGFKDLKDKVIKTVGNPGDRFSEDALRLMRAVRLAVELGFSIENETFLAMKANSALIDEVSRERIRDEFVRILISKQPKMGIELMDKVGLLARILPELVLAKGVTQNQAHSYDVYEHLLRSLQHAADKDWPLEIRLSALFHDIAKPKTKAISRETGVITFYNHELVGSRETRKILEKMKFPREIIEKVTKLVRWHMFFSDTEVITLHAVRRMIANVGKDTIWDLVNLRVCDRIGTGRPKENPYRLRKYQAMIEQAMKDPVSLNMLKIDGNRIMEVCNIKPSPKVGYILHALFTEVLKDPSLNTAEYLEKRSVELAQEDENILKKMGEEGKEIKAEEQEKDIEEINKKYHVS